MTDFEYAALEINISSRRAGVYSVEFRFETAGMDSQAKRELGEANFNFNELRMKVLDPEAYGRELTDSLLGDEKLRKFFSQSLTIAQNEEKKLRILLWLHESAKELHDLRWETLRNIEEDDFIALDENVQFSRYLQEKGRAPVRIPEKEELNALVVIANPQDLAEDKITIGNRTLHPIDVAGELERAKKGLAGVKSIDYLISEPQNLGSVTIEQFLLQLHKGYDIVYLVCHGALLGVNPHDPTSDKEPNLWFEGEDGGSSPTRGEELVQWIQDLASEKRPLLMVLASCQSSGKGRVPGSEESSDEGLFTALGPRLMFAGVPAVIAMQGNISMKSITKFIPVFFEELIEDGRLDRSMAVARSHIRKQLDWWVPVLFTRLKYGCLYRQEDDWVEASEYRVPFLFQLLKLSQIFGKFILNNLLFIVLVVVLEIALFLGFYKFTELYRIPFWAWIIAATLLFAVAVGWYKLKWNRGIRAFKSLHYLTLIFSIFVLIVIGWQVWRIVIPDKFDRQVYGIALADIDDDDVLQQTEKAREISEQTFYQLCEDLTGSSNNIDDDSCSTEEGNHLISRIQIKRIGTVTEPQIATAIGDRLDADIVIWGQLLSTGDKTAEIRFEFIELPDRSVDPRLPIVVPITDRSINFLSRELVLADNQEEIKNAVSKQSRILSSFALGLVNYLNNNTRLSSIHFEKAIQEYEGADLNHVLESCLQSSTTEDVNDNSLMYFYLGRSYQGTGLVTAGNQWLECAKRLNTTEPAIPIGLGLGYRSLGEVEQSDANWDEALDKLNDWINKYPNDSSASSAYYDRGILYLARKKYTDAVLDLEKALELNPDYFIGYMSLIALAQAYSKNGDFEIAVGKLDEALELAKREEINPSWAYLNLAVINETLSLMDEAKRYFQQAIDIDPENDWLYFYYAEFLENQKEYDAAWQAFSDLTKVSLNTNWAYGNFANFLKRHGLYQDAKENYLIALHDNPEDAILRTYLAETYMKLGEYNTAIYAFEQAIENDSRLSYTYAKYGELMYQRGENQRAIELLHKALEIDPEHPEIMINLATVYKVSGDMDKARQFYEKIIEKEGQFPQIIVDSAREAIKKLDTETPEGG
jgi:tetratricopeptide (TPR) repeat protein